MFDQVSAQLGHVGKPLSLDIFLRGAGPLPGLVGAFALGLPVVDLPSNLIYDLFTVPERSLAHTWRLAIACLLLNGLANLLYQRD